MSVEASLEFVCHHNGKSICDILRKFIQIGWNIYNSSKCITYLPLGDDDQFNWVEEEHTEDLIFQIIEEKEMEREVVGVVLYWNNTNVGVTMLLRDSKNIMLSINVNRKTIVLDNKFFTTDVNWYVKHIILALENQGCVIERYMFEEY